MCASPSPLLLLSPPPNKLPGPPQLEVRAGTGFPSAPHGHHRLPTGDHMVTMGSLHLLSSIPPPAKPLHTDTTLCPSDILGKPWTDTGEWFCILWEPQLKSVGYLLWGFSPLQTISRGNADPLWLFLQGLKKQERYIFSEPQGHASPTEGLHVAFGETGEPDPQLASAQAALLSPGLIHAGRGCACISGTVLIESLLLAALIIFTRRLQSAS